MTSVISTSRRMFGDECGGDSEGTVVRVETGEEAAAQRLKRRLHTHALRYTRASPSPSNIGLQYAWASFRTTRPRALRYTHASSDA
ncbi:hypothetical protein NDU88_003448 [Pleurodeles waltl]|uniref:Uncharacterized protein n=1 Tax=Pleurodeles waltl TaxID=8319 RepID=A0AAV7WSG3_PLEWA|nr:hypothetical protein NDU88_003448 [Pleurodeles waltl]